MGWASVEDVELITGITVDAPTLAQADAVITTYANRTDDVLDKLRDRDKTWLKRAAAFQAAWMVGQAGVLARNMGTRIDVEGLSIDHQAEYELVLAPLAARTLRNLSWLRSRSVVTRSEDYRRSGAWNFTLESSDVYGNWQPLW